jgi:hypothetical protein
MPTKPASIGGLGYLGSYTLNLRPNPVPVALQVIFLDNGTGVPPYGKYQWSDGQNWQDLSGTSVAVANNLTTNDPTQALSAAQGVVIQNLIDSIPGGGGVTQIPFNSVLNMSGQYSYPDTVCGPGLTLTKPATLAAGASLAFNLIGNGTDDVAYGPGINVSGDAFNHASGRVNNMLAGENAGFLFLNNKVLGTITALVSAEVQDANKNKVIFTVNDAVTAVPAPGDFTFSDGKTCTAVVSAGSTFTATVNANFAAGATVTVSIPAGKFATASGTNSAVTAFPITNNVQFPTRADNMTRANSTLTMNSPSDGGSGYVSWLGGANAGILANQGYFVNGTIDSIQVLNTGNVDTSAQFVGLYLPNDEYPCIIFKGVDPNNYMRGVIHVATGGFILQKVIAGANSGVISEQPCGFTSGDTVKFQPRSSGSGTTGEIWVAVNGGAFTHIVALDYAIPPELAAGTFFGVECSGNGNNFRITQFG